MGKGSDVYNDLPPEVREKVAGVMLENQIRDYRISLTRVKRAYESFRRETLKHIANCEKALREWENEIARKEPE